MWKKTEEPIAPATPTPPPASRTPRGTVATIGPSIRIQGDLSGEEDLVIQGRLEGGVALEKHNVTVGKNGRVKADIHGRSIHVEGEVQGNLHGSEEVVIRASGRVRGNIVCPRVTLENGAKFKGSIDMEPKSAPAASGGSPRQAPAPAREGRPGAGSGEGSRTSTPPRQSVPAKTTASGS